MSEQPKFTPGPWHLINAHCVGGPVEPGWDAAGSGIAHCGMRARTPEEAAANARAIAALPDLHEALLPFARLAEAYDGRVYPPDRDSQTVGVTLGDLRNARAALAKAEGRP